MSEVAWYDWLVFGCAVCLVVWGGFQLLVAVFNAQVKLGGYSFRGGSEVDRVRPGTLCESPASGGLRLLCVLDQTGVRKVFPTSRAFLPRLSTGWSPVLPRWAVDGDAKALLQAARAQREATQVLVCDSRQWACNAARADS